MASYDLKCNTCDKDFEVFCLGFLKDEVKVCPECGGRDVKQRFTGFGGVTGLLSGSCLDTGTLLTGQQLFTGLGVQLSALSMRPVGPHTMR